MIRFICNTFFDPSGKPGGSKKKSHCLLRMGRLSALVLAIMLTPFSLLAEPFDHTHGIWNRLLEKNVKWDDSGKSSCVSYQGFSRDRKMLENYLEKLSGVEEKSFALWSRDKRLSFLINAYNAFTAKLILTRYPGTFSIRDLGENNKSPWKIPFVHILGRKISLDILEHELIRGEGAFNEPLIHVALVCAARSCPPLRSEAYTHDKLDEMLLDNLRRFMSDEKRNRYAPGEKTLWLSRIFNWYEEDFQKGYRGYDSLMDFTTTHADLTGLGDNELQSIRKGDFRIRFLKYDWALNDCPK